MKTMQKKLSNVFYVILGLPATAMGFGLSVQIAVLSWILRSKYGLNIEEIGIVWAAGPIAGILGQPIVGLMSDNVVVLGWKETPVHYWRYLGSPAIFALPHIGFISHTLGMESIIGVAITVL